MSKVKKEYKELLSILDEILSYLVNNTDNYKVSFYKMSEDVFKIEKEITDSIISTATTFEEVVEEIFSNFKKPQNKINDLRLATIHLHNKGLIIIDFDKNIELTFKGLLTYSEGIVNTWDSQLSTYQRLKNMEDENLLHQSRMTNATEQMNLTNKSIRNLTCWIVFGTLIAVVYQVIEILKSLFPCWFCKIQ